MRDSVAAEPIQEILREQVSLADHLTVAEHLFPESPDPWSFLYRVLEPSRKRIHFDLADKILCRLGISWQSSAALSDEYEAVDLLSIDITHPTCAAAKEETDALIVERYRENRNYQKLGPSFGVANWVVREVLEAAGEIPKVVSFRFCRNGHDTDVHGRESSGSCRECRRLSSQRKRDKRAAEKAARLAA